MKIRLDFVTNSSSSSFTCVAMYSEELYNFLQNLIADKRYVHQPGWSYGGPEKELHLKWAWEELKFDRNDFKVQTTEEYGSTDKESIYKYICYFFEDLSPDEKDTLRNLISDVYKKKEYQTQKYKDQTDGYIGFDFKGKLTKADLEGGSKKEKIQELLMKIENVSVDPNAVDFSMKAIGMPFSKIDGRGVYDPESGRYDHIDKSFLNRVRIEWDRGLSEEYNRSRLEDEKKDKWGEYLQSVYDEAIDDIGAIALYGYSPNNDYVVVMDSVDSAIEKYVVWGFMNNHDINMFGYLDDEEIEKLEILKENYFIAYLKGMISFINDTNKGRGSGETPIAAILESQLHDYLMKTSSLGGVTPKPVVGPNGTVRQKIPKGIKKTIDRDISELFVRWPSRVVNPKTRTYEKIAKDVENNKELLGYASVDDFLDAYGFSIKQDTAKGNAIKYGDFEYTKQVKKNEVTIERYTGSDTKVIIPDSIDGCPVRTLGKDAFCRNKNVEEVIVPDSVETMRGGAFSFCGKLKRVHLSNSISKIVSATFDGCNKLEEINIPDMVSEMPSGLFKDCPLKTLYIGKSLPEINRMDFYKGEYLEEGNIVSGFTKTSALESIVIDPQNKHLKSDNSIVLSNDGKVLFAMLGDDTCCKIPEGVEIIADMAFANQGFLREVYFPETLRLIGNRAFEYTGLEEVSFPESLKIIGYCAFHWCKKLMTVNFSEGLEEIYSQAFYSTCVSNVVLPDSLKRLGKQSFDHWKVDSVEPRKWADEMRRWGASFPQEEVNTRHQIRLLLNESKQAEVASQLENKTGLGLLVLMMAYLQSKEAETIDPGDRLKLERIIISKEMETILGTDLKLILSTIKDKADAQLRDCISYLKTEADKESISGYFAKIKETFGSDKDIDLLLEKAANLIDKEA